MLVDALKQEKLPLSVFLGGELLLTPQVLERAQAKDIPTLHDTPYVLLELPFYQPVPSYANDVLFNLQVLGYKPILAHPERATALQKHPQFLESFARAGVLFQVNAGSLLGRYGKSARNMATHLLHTGKAHFLATDSHNLTGPQDFSSLQSQSSLPITALAHENPSRLMSGSLIQEVPPVVADSFFSRILKRLS